MLRERKYKLFTTSLVIYGHLLKKVKRQHLKFGNEIAPLCKCIPK